MIDTPTKTERIFSVTQANATLPLVKSIVKDIVELSQQVFQTRRRLDYLAANRAKGLEYYDEELVEMTRQVEEDEQRLSDLISEINQLGVEVANMTGGEVEFPSMRGNEPVYLYWQLNDHEVCWWYPANSDKSERRPVESSILDEFGSGSNCELN